MNKVLKAAPVLLLALCLASTSWAGGANCTPDGAKTSAAKSASAGSHCSGKDASGAMAAKECGVKANQVMYSFAVPSVECGNCIDKIQKTAMAKNGIHCAHVDLQSHTAYIIADKKLSRRDVSKLIAQAGYKNSFTAQGEKAQAAFAKATSAGHGGTCGAKAKDKV